MIENEHKNKKKDKTKFNQMQLVVGRVKLSLGNTPILLWVYLIYITAGKCLQQVNNVRKP